MKHLSLQSIFTSKKNTQIFINVQKLMLMVRKIVLSIVAVLAVSFAALAQNMQVTGTVVDEAGYAIVGATVVVDGTNAGAVTGESGHFSVNAPKNGSLTISFIGYEAQVVAIAGQQKINVVLKQDTQNIDNVIVVAYGTTKKEAFTGSASVMKSEDLDKRQTSNVLNTLVGSVPGLQMRGASGVPGSTGSINVRGISSLEASTEPLIIVDGAPYSASLSNIAQTDIESMTILKDAASAALYGARGAAGVILITTKKARNKEATITVDAKWGVGTRAAVDYDVIKDPGEYYEAYYAQLYNKYYYGDGMAMDAAHLKANESMLGDLKYNVFSYPAGETLVGQDGKLNPKAKLGRRYEANGETYYLTPDDWMDETYKTSLRQEYNINLNGSSNRTNYYMSVGYLDEEGIVKHYNFERFTARIKADYQARKWLNVGANVGFVSSESIAQGNSAFGFTSYIAPIFPVYVRKVNAGGVPYIVKDAQGNNMYDFSAGENSYPGLLRPYSATSNPLGMNEYDENRSGGNQLNATFTAQADITSWLKANIQSTITWGFTDALSTANMFVGNAATTNGAVTRSNTSTFRQNHLQTLTFYKTFGDHNVNVMAGHEYYLNEQAYIGAKSLGMFSPDVPEINATAGKNQATASSYRSGYNVEGYMLSAQYDYASKYFASFSFRRDASSYFDKNHRWGNFWSVGGAWIMTKENWLSDVQWLDMLKFKASIGQQGNDSIGSWAYIDLYNIIKDTDTSTSTSFYRKGNPNITWETTTNFNTGIEFSLWQGRLSGNLDVYSKKTTDLLFWVSIPESSGTRGMYDNIGDIRNTGIELSLSADVIRTKMVNWNISANIAHNKTKILSLPASKIDPLYGGYSETTPNNYNQYWMEEGGELHSLQLPHYVGVDAQGKAMFQKTIYKTDANGDVVAGEDGRAIIEGYTTTYDFNEATEYAQGSGQPDVFGGFSTSLRVGNFDVSAIFDYQIGGEINDLYYASLMAPSTSPTGETFHKDYLKSWSPNNTSSDIPRWQYNDQYTAAASDRFMTDASYLNFQSFTVGYTIPEKLFSHKAKLRVYVAGENLCYWSARKGLDPRYSFEGNTYGISYSPVRTITGGIQLTF